MHTLTVRDHPVAYDAFGPNAAHPLLLLHGAGHDRGIWQDVAERLAQAGRRVITPDLPAHGDSGGDACPSIDAMADWVLAFADALGLNVFDLGGHSMGSLVALAAADAAPGRIDHLILIGSLAPMPVAPFVLDAARNDPPQAHALINKFSFAPAERIGDARRQALETANLARLQRNGAAVLASDLGACDAWQDGLAAARRRVGRSLLVCGEVDRMTPVKAVAPLLEALQATGDAHLVVLPGCGHGMLEEDPAAVVQALLAG